MTHLEFIKFLIDCTNNNKIIWTVDKSTIVDYIETKFYVTESDNSKITYTVSYKASENVIFISDNSKHGETRVIRLDRDSKEVYDAITELVNSVITYWPDTDEEYLSSLHEKFSKSI